MQRIAFTITLRPGADPAEYERRDDEIWPEMAAALRAAGIHNYRKSESQATTGRHV